MKTFSPNLYFFLIFFIFSISVDSQDIDADLLMELSDSNISLARSLLDGESIQNNLEENSDAIDVDETLLEIENEETNLESDDTEIGLKKFGYDFFSTMPTSVSAIGDLPLPNNYKISIKDQFSIILSGTRKNIFDLSVKLDGTIIFP